MGLGICAGEETARKIPEKRYILESMNPISRLRLTMLYYIHQIGIRTDLVAEARSGGASFIEPWMNL